MNFERASNDGIQSFVGCFQWFALWKRGGKKKKKNKLKSLFCESSASINRFEDWQRAHWNFAVKVHCSRKWSRERWSKSGKKDLGNIRGRIHVRFNLDRIRAIATSIRLNRRACTSWHWHWRAPSIRPIRPMKLWYRRMYFIIKFPARVPFKVSLAPFLVKSNSRHT